MSHRDTVIIGGGVAGCSLAYLLEQRGMNVTLLEKGEIGGLLREIEFDSGYYCDSAPHLLFFDEETEPEVGELFSQLTDLTHHDFYAATYPEGRLDDPHHYPVTEENIDRWADAEEIREEVASTPGHSDADNFEEYVLDQVGPTLYERYYRSYTEKHWGIQPEHIVGDWFDFKINFPESERDFFGDGAYYPEATYADVLSEMITDCKVVFEGATGLITDGDQVEGVRTESGDVVTGDTYVSTIDPSLLVGEGDQLRYRSMVILGVHVVADERPFPSHVDWGYFPNDYAFTRLTDYGFTPQSLPDNEYILTAEFPCFTGDDRWTHPDEWFEHYLEEFLEAQGIDIEVIAAEVRRAPRAYPLPRAEDLETFERLQSQLSSYENLFTLGRNSTYEYIWIKDIVKRAYEIADELSLDS